ASMIATAVLLIAFIHHRSKNRPAPERDPDESQTHHSRPHRTAVCLSTKVLLDLLMKIDAEVQRSAREDGWKVDWEAHDAAVAAAQEAYRQKRYAKGVREICRSICSIMDHLP